MLVLIAVRRFVCRHCPVTVSCLPQFAQPYRLVCNETIEAFFAGEKDRVEIARPRGFECGFNCFCRVSC